jgi:hypothetical protein
VQWTTLLGTLVGAAIAMGTALLVQARRDRHELAAEWRRTRRELYMTFLDSLAQARSELLALSKKTGMTADDLDETARQVFARCYGPRHHLELVAPDEVAEHAVEYFRSVRTLRDLVAAGRTVTDPDWEPVAAQVKRILDTAQEAMRQDLQRAHGT